MKKTQLKNIIRGIVKEITSTQGVQFNEANTEAVIEREGQYASSPDGGQHDVCVLLVGGKAFFGYMGKFDDKWDYSTFEKIKDNSNNGHQYFGSDEVESVEPLMISTGGPAKVRVHIKNRENVDLFIEGSIARAEDVKNDSKCVNFKVEKTGWSATKKPAMDQVEEPLKENGIKRSELKIIIREAVEEAMNSLDMEQKQKLEEKAPPDFPKKLHDKLLKQYKDDESKAYATMWKIFHAKNAGNKKINEMWMAFEEKDHDETDLSNPEENKEVEIGKKIQDLVSRLLAIHGVTAEEDKEPESVDEIEGEGEENPDDPSENEEIEIAREIKSLANELLALHGISDEETSKEEPEAKSDSDS